MTDPSQSDGSPPPETTAEPYDCPTHGRDWQLLCQTGRRLCLCCAQNLWINATQSDAKKRQYLSDLDSSLRYGSGHLSQVFAEQPYMGRQIMTSVAQLLFHSEPQMHSLAKNCLSQLCAHTSDLIKEPLFSDMIQKIIGTIEDVNVSVMEFFSDIWLEHPILSHPLKVDLNSLITWTQMNYQTFDVKLKSASLQSLIKLYEGSRRCHLFGLQVEWHLLNLKIALAAFEDLTLSLLDHSVQLLKQLSIHDSVRDALVDEHNPFGFLELIVSTDCDKLKTNFMDWICQLLEEDNVVKYLATETIESVIDSLILMVDSKNPDLMSYTFECLNLILGSTSIDISLTSSRKLIKHIIQSLYLSDKIAETTLFKSALASMKYVVEKSRNNQLFDEFDFFSVLDLFENCFDDSELLELILKFLFELFDPSLIPTMIPTLRMTTILCKVSQNIPIPSVHRKTPKKYIHMASDCVKLIEKFVMSIVSLKTNEFLSDEKDCQILNIEERAELTEVDIDTADDHKDSEPKPINHKSDVFDFFKNCLKIIERFAIESLERLIIDLESEDNVILLVDVCSCLKALITNELLIIEEMASFVIRMFSNGYLLHIYQLLWFANHSMKNRQEICELASVLALFLVVVQQSEYKSKSDIQFGDSFTQKWRTYENEILYSYEKMSKISEFDDKNKFYETFFALNYYFLKFDRSAIHSTSFEYKIDLIQVINHYLKNDLKTDTESETTVKHCLFISSLIDFEDIGTVETTAWKQFFDNKNLDFVAKYYTNHISLVQWFFNQLGSENLCEYALRQFIADLNPPDDFGRSSELPSMFALINSNETALRLFIKVLCDPECVDEAIDIVDELFSDSNMDFINDSNEFNQWKTFCDNVFEQMPKILIESVRHIRSVLWQEMSPSQEIQTIKLLSFVSQLLVTERQISDELFQLEFHQFVHEIVLLIDQQLTDTSVTKIFDFLRKCYLFSDELLINEKSLTEDLLNSKTAVILMVDWVDNHSIAIESRESSVYLLCKISETKVKCHLDHNLRYDLDLIRIIELMNSKLSESTVESAFRLLVTCLDWKQYFSSTLKSKEQKTNEIRTLFYWCQNSVFTHAIQLPEYTCFLRTLFTCLDTFSYDLMQHLMTHPSIETLVVKLTKDSNDDHFWQEMIDYFMLFCPTDNNGFRILNFNRIIQHLIGEIEKQQQRQRGDETTDDEEFEVNYNLIHSGIQLLKAIESRVGRRSALVIDRETRDRLNQLIAGHTQNTYFEI